MAQDVTGFDSPTVLTSSANPKGRNRTAVGNGMVYVAWEERVGGQGMTDVMLQRVGGNGAKPDDRVHNLSMSPDGTSEYPDIAAAGDTVFVVWTELTAEYQGGVLIPNREVFYTRSNDGGISFQAPRNLSNSHGQSYLPRVAAMDGKYYVVWEELGEPDPQMRGIFLATINENDGVEIKKIADTQGLNRPTFPVVAASAPYVNVFYVDDVSVPGQLVRVRSTDGGATFGVPTLVLADSGNAYTGSRLAAVAREKMVYLAYAVEGSPRVIRFTFSADGGEHYHEAIDVASAGDASGPTLAVTQSIVHLAWAQSDDIWYTANSSPAAFKFPAAVNISSTSGSSGEASLAAEGTNVFISWNDDTSGPTQVYFAGAPDSDGDGLLDSWEIAGVPVDGVLVTLPCTLNPDTGERVCPSPTHKDIYVEIDYMKGHRPHEAALNDVVRAFAKAPVNNPDGKTGINLHLMVDDSETIPHQDVILLWDGFDAVKQAHLGTAAEHADSNWAAIRRARSITSHYSLYVHQFAEPGNAAEGASGVAKAFGGDTIISLGAPGWGTRSADLSGVITAHTVGTRDEQSGTFMHELGHDLGLWHGGSDSINCKPNYLSIMSYTRQFAAPIAERPLDYSREALDTLDEKALLEINGLSIKGQPVPAESPVLGLRTVWGPKPRKIGVTGGALDWNKDGDLDLLAPQTADINNVMKDCDSKGLETLTSQNDWEHLVYNFRASGQSRGATPPETTADSVREFRLSNVEAIDYQIALLPPQAYDSVALAGQHQTDLHAGLITAPNSVAALIEVHDYTAAIGAVRGIRSLMDGSGGNDWIVEPNAQRVLLDEIDNLILVLEKGADYGLVQTVANAGDDQSVEEAAVVKLNGLQSYDPDGSPLVYSWQQVGGPAVTLSDSTSGTPSFTAPQVSTSNVLTFRLVVTAGNRSSAPANVTITVSKHLNHAPLANAGAARTVYEGAVVVLDGSASYDPDATTPLTYSWQQTAGPQVSLQNETSASPSFVAPDVSADTVLTFSLIVSDGVLSSTSASVQITVRDRPPATTLGMPVPVSARGSDSPMHDLAVAGTNVYVVEQKRTPSSQVVFRASHDSGATFGNEITFGTGVDNYSSRARVAAHGDNVYVLWCQKTGVASDSPTQVLLAASHDRGVTFAPAINLGAANNFVPQYPPPDIAVSGDTVYVAYMSGTPPAERYHVRVRVSRDAGVSFAAEQTLEDASTGFAPAQFRVAASGPYAHVAWSRDEYGEVWVRSSSDNGVSFSPAAPIAQIAAVPPNYWTTVLSLQGLAAEGSNVHVMWWARPAGVGARYLVVRSSHDAGLIYDAPLNINAEGSTTGNRLAVSGSDVYVQWPRFNAGQMQTRLSLSHDNGTTFNPALDLTPLHSFSGLADDDHSITAFGSNVFYVTPLPAPPSNQQLVYAASTDQGAHFTDQANLGCAGSTYSSPAAPRVVATAGGVFTIWRSLCDGSLMFSRAVASGSGGLTDDTVPLISASVSPLPNMAGWNNRDVTVTWTVTDPETGIASSSGCDPVTLTAATAGTVLTCTAFNGADGSASRSIMVRIDKTPPVIHAQRTPPNAAGWNDADVIVDALCSDDASGVDACGSGQQIVGTEGGGHSVAVTASDLAGNIASVTIDNINIDKTAPSITFTRTPPADQNGWNYGSVTVTAACTDAVSGVDSCSPASQVVATVGTGQVVSATARDRAGNAVVASTTINIASTYPTTTALSATAVTFPAAGQVTVTVTSPNETPSGTAMISVDGGTAQSAALVNGSATFTLVGLNAGTHNIVANYSDTARNYSPSTANGTLVVNPALTTTAISGPATSFFGQQVTFTATVTSSVVPTGEITFVLDGTAIASSGLNGTGQAQFTSTTLHVGSHTLSATYAAQTNFAASNSTSSVVVVAEPELSVSVPPAATVIVPPGGSGALSLTVSSKGTLANPVTFACTGLPVGAQCVFEPSSVPATALPANVRMTVTTVTTLASAPSARTWELMVGTMLVGTVVILPISLRNRSRRQFGVAVGLLLLLLIITSMVACGGHSRVLPPPPQTPAPGTYTLMVISTSGSAKASVSATLVIEARN